MDVTFCLHDHSYKQKPQGLAQEISSRIASCHVTMDIERAADLIGNRGHTFCPAVFHEDTRRAEYFEGEQMFALDFDKGTSYEEIVRRCEEYRLNIAFSYHTFSSTPDYPRFRIVFLHICPIYHKKAAEIIIGLLMVLFPEADRNCKDVSRMFYGGKGLIEVHPGQVFQMDQLAMEVEHSIRSRAGKNSAREISRIAGQLGIGCLNGSFGIGVDFPPACQSEGISPNNIITISNGENSSFYIMTASVRHNAQADAKRPGGHKEIRIELRKIEEQCRLFREFCQGEWDEHQYKFGLMTNLRYIEGGMRAFYKVIKFYKSEKSLQHWKDQYKYIYNNGYHPMRCERMGCPYCDTCNHKASLVSTLKSRERAMEKVGGEPKYDTPKNVFNHIANCLEQAVKSKQPGFYLIKAQTAIGKTHLYCNYISNSSLPFIIAVPTNLLKREVYQKLLRMGCRLPVIEFPSLDDIDCPLPRELIQKIKEGYRLGLPESLTYLREFIKENEEEHSLEIIRQVNYGKEYLAFREQMNGKNHVILTHARLLTLSQDLLKRYQVIVDEDILTTLFYGTDTIMNRDLEKLHKSGIGGSLAQKALAMDTGTYAKNPSPFGMGALSKKELEKLGISGNANSFLNCSTYCRMDESTVCYFEAKALPEGKYIVLSATLNRRLYEDYFPGKYVKEYEAKTAKYKGALIQYYYYSTSRAGLKRHPQIFEAVRKICGELPIITFKEYDDREYNAYGLHIGNAVGVNVLEGKDLAVVATPYNREEIYKLIALHLSYDISGQMKNRKVEANGYRFIMMTYNNRLLRGLQLYFMESDLEQTIGRARLLRNECRVYLFSNYPCGQAELKGEDYLEEKTTT